MRAALALAFLASDAGAQMMALPARSADLAAPIVLTGLGSPTRDGLGVTLSTRRAARSKRRSGTTDVGNPGGESTMSRSHSLLLDYRALDRLTAIAAIPYSSYRADGASGMQRAEGLGDVSLLAKWSAWRDEKRRELLLLAGVELPTGSTTRADALGNRLSAPQQPGSGTVDLLAGAALVWPWPALTSWLETSYKRNSKRAYTFGDIAAAGAGADWPLPFERRASLRGTLQFERIGSDRSLERGPGVDADGTVRDSGSRKLSFAPGLQVRPWGAWALTASVALPLYQDFNGIQLKDEPVWTFSVSTRLFGSRDLRKDPS